LLPPAGISLASTPGIETVYASTEASALDPQTKGESVRWFVGKPEKSSAANHRVREPPVMAVFGPARKPSCGQSTRQAEQGHKSRWPVVFPSLARYVNGTLPPGLVPSNP